MQHRTESTYRTSNLARTKVKKSGRASLFIRLFKQKANANYVEDQAGSTAIIRVIVGLLLVHLIIIGGIILHGKIENAPATTTAAIEAPPTEAPPIILTEPEPVPGPTANPTTITQPVATTTPVAAPTTPVVAPATPVAPATQPEVSNEVEIVSLPTEPVVEKPAVETKPKEAAFKLVQVMSGDNLRKIAERNKVTVQAILAINPEITNPNILQAGHKIRIPLAADSQEAKNLAKTREAERIEKEGLDYTVKSGDTLSKLQRMFGSSVEEIQKLNNMGKSTNLRVGQKIKIPATDKAKKKLQK